MTGWKGKRKYCSQDIICERKLYIFEQPFPYTGYLDKRLLGLVDEEPNQ